MEISELMQRITELEYNQKLHDKYFEWHKSQLEKQEKLLEKLDAAATEQKEHTKGHRLLIEQHIKQMEQNGQLIRMLLDKPNFWETANGKKLFKVILLMGSLILLASFGLSNAELIKAVFS